MNKDKLISRVVEDIMEEEHDVLTALADNEDDCCASCGCALDDGGFQWLVRLADGRLAVYVEDEEDCDYKPCIVVIEPIDDAAGVFRESPNKSYTLEDLIDGSISISPIRILLKRKGYDKWVVVEGIEC